MKDEFFVSETSSSSQIMESVHEAEAQPMTAFGLPPMPFGNQQPLSVHSEQRKEGRHSPTDPPRGQRNFQHSPEKGIQANLEGRERKNSGLSIGDALFAGFPMQRRMSLEPPPELKAETLLDVSLIIIVLHTSCIAPRSM